MARPLELTGCVFGRLTVLRLHEGAVGRKWVCRCSCGEIKIAGARELRSGHTRSCGCLRSETLSARNTTHGESGSYTYRKWQFMHRRVAAPVGKSECYAGVSIDPRWRDYQNFLDDMGPCAPGESLDRIDNTKGYCKDNCRWIPLFKQASNTRRNVFVDLDGERLHLSEAARRRGLTPDVVSDRINKLGWDTHRALNTPLRPQRARKSRQKETT